VLEGGGVEDLGGAMDVEKFVEENAVVDVAEDGEDLSLGVCCGGGEFGIDFIQVLFGVIEQNHGADLIVW